MDYANEKERLLISSSSIILIKPDIIITELRSPVQTGCIVIMHHVKHQVKAVLDGQLNLDSAAACGSLR